MDNGTTLGRTEHLDAAPRERVWRAVTDPVQLQQWYSSGTTWQLSALEVGGMLVASNPETGAALHIQGIEQVERPQRFVLRTTPEPTGTFQVTAYTLHEEDGGTRLIVTNSGYETMPDEGRWNAMEQNAFGFGMMLENVKASIEGNDLPYPYGF
jgi:uncharacterized protein YndB with AHSA1/START domain